MIRDNLLTYTAKPPEIYTWRPSNEAIFVLSVAVITTVLSYQLTAILIDVLFGLKPFGVSTAADLQIIHLVRSASPLAVSRSLFPGAYSAAQERTGVDSQVGRPKGERRYIRASVLLKLLFALLIAPLLNCAAIVVGLEYNTNFTFVEAGFGGIALGVNHDLSVTSFEQVARGASRIPLHTARYDLALAEFLTFSPQPFIRNWDRRNQKGAISIQAFNYHNIVLTVATPERVVSTIISGRVVPSGSETLLIRLNLTKAAAERLLQYGISLLAEWCGLQSVEEGAPLSITSIGSFVNISREITCPGRYEDDSEAESSQVLILQSMSQRVTLVDSPTLQVARAKDIADLLEKDWEDNNVSPEEFLGLFSQAADNLLLLRRRRSYVSFTTLALTLAVVIFVRLLTAVLTHNDLALGSGLHLREALGLPWCDTMLASRNVRARSDTGAAFVEVENDISSCGKSFDSL